MSNTHMTAVPGVPVEDAVEVLAETLGKHRYIDTWGDYEEAPYTRQFGCTCGWEQNIAGMNGWTSWLAAHQSHVAEHLAAAALPSLREGIAAEVLAPVRALADDRGRVARNLRLLAEGAAGKHCVVCDHVRHNELAYCQISGCVCSTGTSVNSTARAILRDLRAELSAPAQAAEPIHVPVDDFVQRAMMSAPVQAAEPCALCGHEDADHRPGIRMTVPVKACARTRCPCWYRAPVPVQAAEGVGGDGD